VVSAVSVASNTISVLPSGATQPVVLFVNPQTVIILNEVQASLSDLAALPAGSTATVSYDVSSLKAVRIEVVTPATTTTATTV
jgi:hypothetical protein